VKGSPPLLNIWTNQSIWLLPFDRYYLNKNQSIFIGEAAVRSIFKTQLPAGAACSK